MKLYLGAKFVDKTVDIIAKLINKRFLLEYFFQKYFGKIKHRYIWKR